jgi:hypothetical protein
MASKLTFGALVLVTAWISLPPGILQGEPPAWRDANSEAGFLPPSAAGNIAIDKQATATSALGPNSPTGELASPALNTVPKGAEFASTLPSVPAPMFPAGPSLAAAGDMIGFTRELAGGSQAITLINASRRWMAVYHVDQAGQIRLVSSRPLDADFSFQFNATAPLPEEIRRLQGG